MINEAKLLKRYGSPLYVYNRLLLMERCNNVKLFASTLKSDLPEITISMHYSTKANNNVAILSVVEAMGLNVDAMSPFELEVAQRAGFSTDRILYVCNNISSSEMNLIHNKGVLICLDSVSQVETYGKLFPGSKIMVRINPGTEGVGHSEKVKTSGKATKFGISEANLPQLFDIAQKYELCIIGIHQHLGSLFLNETVDDYITGVQAGLDIVKKYFRNVEIVDLGGGFGVPYQSTESPLNLLNVAETLVPILKKFVADYPSVKEFKFEPGRYIPCESGSIYGTVTAIKYENGIYWICTDIGMNVLVRPAMYDSYHDIQLIYLSEGEHKQVTANFCGNICESGDILGKDRVVGLPEVGDIVIVKNAGAYGYSMASNYTGRPKPAEVMINSDNHPELIRRAENLDSMLRPFGKLLPLPKMGNFLK